MCELGDPAALDVVRARFGGLGDAPALYQFSILRLVGAVGQVGDLPYVAARLAAPALVAPAADALIALHARLGLAALPPDLVSALGAALDAVPGPLEAAHHGLLALLQEFAATPTVGAIVARALPRVTDGRQRRALTAPLGARPPTDDGER